MGVNVKHTRVIIFIYHLACHLFSEMPPKIISDYWISAGITVVCGLHRLKETKENKIMKQCLDDLKLHSFISLRSNKTSTDDFNNSINQAFSWCRTVRRITSEMPISDQFLMTQQQNMLTALTKSSKQTKKQNWIHHKTRKYWGVVYMQPLKSITINKIISSHNII